MSRYWSAVVHDLTPYVPGEQPKLANLVKLNTNENPYGPSPRVLDAVRAEAADTLRLYPDPGSDRLCAAIAAYHGVAAEQVFVGNGSDEVLAHAFLALLKHERPILFPDISYSFYPVYCGLYEIAYRQIPLTDIVRDQGRRLSRAQRRGDFPQSQCAHRAFAGTGRKSSVCWQAIRTRSW